MRTTRPYPPRSTVISVGSYGAYKAEEANQWKAHALDLRLRVEELTRLLDMAREEIAWLREKLPGTPVVPDLTDGHG